VLRPSSYCGIFGYKPTYNMFNKAGAKPAAESIDTIGWLARSIDDIALLTAVLGGQTPQPPRGPAAAPRIGLCRTELWDSAQAETKAAVETAADQLGKAGATVREIALPQAFAGLPGLARGTINHFERAACMAFEWDHHREALSPQMRRYVESGQKTSREEYVAAWRGRGMPRLAAEGVRGFDVLLCLRARRSAKRPRVYRRSWHASDVDGVAYAGHDAADHRGPNDLPVGIQLIAQRYDDDRLFAAARWIGSASGCLSGWALGVDG